jgi:cGMP-dependent protein kinase 2
MATGPGRVVVAIVGSGPAGLSAAAHAARLGLSHVLIEKTDHLSDTIYKYQKGKHVMATPSNLVLRSDLDFDAGKRETILGLWDEQIAAGAGQRALQCRGDRDHRRQGRFHPIAIKGGEPIHAENVVLAIGTQGNPNLLRCPAGTWPHVQYQLDDPANMFDEHITVVGSGDAGIENALGLAADPAQRNVVTILNRGADFARAKGANVKLLQEAEDEGRVIVMRETSPAEVRAGELVLEHARRAGGDSLRPDHRPHRLAPPRGLCRSCGIEFTSEDRLALSRAVPGVRDDQARHLRDRRAGRLSADQALHEPGL